MPQKNKPLVIEAYTAEGDLSALWMCAVIEGTADGQVKAPGGASVAPVGILLTKNATAGKPVQVAMFGPSFAKAKSAWSRGAQLRIAGTDGKLEAITAGVTTAVRIAAIALEAATAEDELRSVWLVGPGAYGATT